MHTVWSKRALSHKLTFYLKCCSSETARVQSKISARRWRMGIPNDYSVTATENILRVSWLDPVNPCLFQNCQKHRVLSYCIEEMGFPAGSVVKNLPAVQETRVYPWVRKIPCRRKWRPTPLFLPEKSHGQRSLEGYSPWSHKRVRYNLVTKQQHKR